MNIGEAAKHSGVSAKMIRYYEGIGLVQRGQRSESGYRIYCESDLRILRFLRRARNVGFSIEEIRELLSPLANPAQRTEEARVLVQACIGELDRRIEQAVAMRDALNHLARTCDGKHKH